MMRFAFLKLLKVTKQKKKTYLNLSLLTQSKKKKIKIEKKENILPHKIKEIIKIIKLFIKQEKLL